MAATSRFSLADVTAQATLGLTAVIPGDPALAISGAHTSEIHDPAKWLEPDSVMLTTGLRFVGVEGDAGLADKLVAELAGANVSALFFGIGVYFDEVPPTLVTACRQAGFPLYTVAPEVPFHHVENFINQSKISPESYVLKRAMWLSNDLLQSISDESPVRALITRLGSICRGTAVLYDDSGQIVESTGEGPLHLMWNEVQAGKDVSERTTVGRWEIMSRPLVLRGNGYRLAVASRNSGVLNELGDVLLETTQRLLGAIHGVNQYSVSKERHENVQLLTELQDGIPMAREFRHWERMRAFRFQPYERVRAVVAGDLENQPVTAPLVEGLLKRASLSGLGLLLAENGRTAESPPGFHALVADSGALDAWLELFDDSLFIGLSEPYTDLATTPEVFREAETAAGIARRQAQAAKRRGSSGRHWIVRLDEVDPATWLLGRQQSQQDSDRVTRYVQGLNQDPVLSQTIIWYLAKDLDVAQVGKALFVHPNTVRYRLKKAEELLGGPLSSSKIIANLYLAYHDDVAALLSP